jgi:ABC-2 type transport system ATP-binding protein
LSNAIELQHVTKTFGPKVAVRDLDLVIEEGSLHGFIGPNGAGKTTTIRMIMSIIFPDRGEIAVLGRKSAIESKDRIGYLPEERGLYKKMRVGRFLRYMARLKGVPAAGLDHKVRGWLDRVGLGAEYRRKCEELSKGMQQKVQFISAIIHEPDLLILDEPFSGLDPVNARMLREMIQEQHESGRTIIFSTHQMSQAEALCDRVVMIHQGRKVLDNTPSEVQSRFDPRSILVEPAAANADTGSVVRLSAVESVRPVGRNIEVHLKDGVEATSVIPALAAAIPARRIEVIRPTLEDVFISIVQGSMDKQEQDQLRQSLKGNGAAAELTFQGAGRSDQGGD